MNKIERAELLTILICYVGLDMLSPKMAFEVGKFYGCVP